MYRYKLRLIERLIRVYDLLAVFLVFNVGLSICVLFVNDFKDIVCNGALSKGNNLVNFLSHSRLKTFVVVFPITLFFN